jgi:flagellar biosynthetic protein FliS
MHAIRQYREQTVHTSSNARVLLLLLERAIQDQAAAVEAIGRGDRKAWIDATHHATSIFIELNDAVDIAAAPELATNLRSIYAWCIAQLQEAQRSGNVQVVQGVHRVTCSLYGTWTEACASAGGQ